MLRSFARASLLLLAAVLAVPALASEAAAQWRVEVICVPAQGVDPNIPHFAYNGRRTLLKAICRVYGPTSGTFNVGQVTGVRFKWDNDLDGDVDANDGDLERTELYGNENSGVTFPNLAYEVNLPTVSGDQPSPKAIQIKITHIKLGSSWKVYPDDAAFSTNHSGDRLTGTYNVLIDPTVPAYSGAFDWGNAEGLLYLDDIVRRGNKGGSVAVYDTGAHSGKAITTVDVEEAYRKIDIVRQIALDDMLWQLHCDMVSRSGAGLGIKGYVSAPSVYYRYAACGAAGWAFEIQGHTPALPESAAIITGGSNASEYPYGSETANDKRWREDPYAEDTYRLLNYIAADLVSSYGATSVVEGKSSYAAADDSPDVDSLGQALTRKDEDGDRFATLRFSTDGAGTTGTIPPDSTTDTMYRMGASAGAVALSGLDKVRCQPQSSGTYTWGHIGQKMSNYFCQSQLDGQGGWYYTEDSRDNSGVVDSSTSQWGVIGLEALQKRMKIPVPRGVESRVATYLRNNQGGNGSAKYRTNQGDNNKFHLTSGGVTGCVWLGFNNFGGVGGNFLDSGIAKTTLKSTYDAYIAHLAGDWYWKDQGSGLYNEGPYNGGTMSDDTVGYRRYRDASNIRMYSMYSFMKAARTHSPNPLTTIGVHDWFREFTVAGLRRLYSDGFVSGYQGLRLANASDYGGAYDSSNGFGTFGGMSTAFLTLTLSSDVFEPPPVAIVTTTAPPTGNCPLSVEFKAETSYSPDPSRRIVEFVFDFGNGTKHTERRTFDTSGVKTKDELIDTVAGVDRTWTTTYNATGGIVTDNGSPLVTDRVFDSKTTYSYQPAGNYVARVSMTTKGVKAGIDDKRATSNAINVTVILANSPPIAEADLANGVAGVTTSDSIYTQSGNATPNTVVREPGATKGYAVRVGNALLLDASASQENDIPCGDHVKDYQWDFNPSGPFQIDEHSDAPNNTTDANPKLVASSADLDVAFATLDPSGRERIDVELRVHDWNGGTSASSASSKTTILRYDDRIDVDIPSPRVTVTAAQAFSVELVVRQTNPFRTIPDANLRFDLNGGTAYATSPTAITRRVRAINSEGFAEAVVDITNTYATIGTYNLNFRAIDDKGKQRTITIPVDVKITNEPPTVSLPAPPLGDRNYQGGYAMSTTETSLTLLGVTMRDTDIVFGDKLLSYTVSVDKNGNGAADANETLLTVTTTATPVPPQGQNQVTFDTTISSTNFGSQGMFSGGAMVTGTYQLIITARDSLGGTATDKRSLYVFRDQVVADVQAVAVAPAQGPITVSCGSPVAFKHSTSAQLDLRRSITSVRYDWGDGSTAETFTDMNQQPTHTYATISTASALPGVPQSGYPVTITVTDDRSKTQTDQIRVFVDVLKVAPRVVSFPPEYDILEGDGVALGAVVADDEFPCGDVYVYSWSVSPSGLVLDAGSAGSSPYTISSPITVQTLAGVGIAAPGDYSLNLRLVDRFGKTKDTPALLRVKPNRPQVSVTSEFSSQRPNVPVGFTAGATHTNDQRRVVSVSFDFGDGSQPQVVNLAQGQIATHVNHTFAIRPVDTTYSVKVTATDDSQPAKTATATASVLIAPEKTPPVAAPRAVTETVVATTVTLDASGSFDPDATYGDSIVVYEWRAHGVLIGTSTAAVLDVSTATLVAALGAQEYPANPFTHLPAATIELLVRDVTGRSSTASAQVVVYGNTPVAALRVEGNSDVNARDSVTLTAAESYHGNPARAITRYLFEFGDGQTYSEEAGDSLDGAFDGRTTHAWTASNTSGTAIIPYTVTVTAFDSSGASSRATTSVLVRPPNHNPEARFRGAPYQFVVGQQIVIDGRDSSDIDRTDLQFRNDVAIWRLDVDADPATFEFESVSGTAATPGLFTIDWAEFASKAGFTVPTDPKTHAPKYKVHMRVIDDADTLGFGLVTGVADVETQVEVYGDGVAAALVASPAESLPGVDVVLDASGSTSLDPRRSIDSYTFQFDDGTSYTETRSSAPDGLFDGKYKRTFALSGASTRFYAVTVTATDLDFPGNTATKSTSVKVSVDNRPPSVTAGGPYVGTIGGSVAFAAVANDPDASFGDQATVAWDFNGDGTYDVTGTSVVVSVADLRDVYGIPLSDVGGTVSKRAVRVLASDLFGGSKTTTADVTIYDDKVIAAGQIVTTPPLLCGTNVVFSHAGSRQSSVERQLASFAWDFGDGSTQTFTDRLAQPSHLYALAGTYPAKVTVSDGAKSVTASVSVVVTFVQANPVVATMTSKIINTEQDLALTVGATDANEGCGDKVTRFDVDFTSNGSADFTIDRTKAIPDPTTQTIPWNTLVAKGVTLGTQIVSVKAFDTTTGVGTGTFSLTVYKDEINVAFAASPASPLCGDPVVFSQSSSQGDLRIPLTDFELDYDYDGVHFDVDARLSGPNATTATSYSSKGLRTAALRVRDGNGKTTIGTFPVDVRLQNVAPVARAGADKEFFIGQAVQLSASTSSDANQACGDHLAFAWEYTAASNAFDDALTADLTLDESQLQALGFVRPAVLSRGTPNTTITRTLRVKVKDDANEFTIDDVVLTGKVNEPVASVSAGSTTILTSCADRRGTTFKASASYHGASPVRAITKYEWDFDYKQAAGFHAMVTTSTAADVFYDAYLTPGTYTTALRVTDNNSPALTDIHTVTVTVRVANTPPVAVASTHLDAGIRVYEILPGGVAWIDASLSSDPDQCYGDRVVTYDWNMGTDPDFSANVTNTSGIVQAFQNSVLVDVRTTSPKFFYQNNTLASGAKQIISLRVIDSGVNGTTLTATSASIATAEIRVDSSYPDTDSDGLTNSEETELYGTDPTKADTDGDGLTDKQELFTYFTNPKIADTDGDGLSDGAEVARTSVKTSPDYADPLDPDTDNDGLSDGEEVLVWHTKPNLADTDGDTVSDYDEVMVRHTNPLSRDTDGDGIEDDLEGAPTRNSDGDTQPDYLDLDSDNDGIPDGLEAGADLRHPLDSDGDGTPDFIDTDSDNDGIPDSVEARLAGGQPSDFDHDGVPDYRDTDSDGDGIPDGVEGLPTLSSPPNSGGTALPDYLDVDSDGDGIPDRIEAGPVTATPRSTDADGVPDYRDTDSDGDGIPDATEARMVNGQPTDTDHDGIPDYLDSDSDGDGIPDSIEARIVAGVPLDTDHDGTPDYLDTDSDDDGLTDGAEDPNHNGIKDATETDGRDADSDDDGVSDGIEVNGPGTTSDPLNPDTDGDGATDGQEKQARSNPRVIDSDGDLIVDGREINEFHTSPTMTATFGGVNDYFFTDRTPTANADVRTIDEDGSIVVDVKGNDTDADYTVVFESGAFVNKPDILTVQSFTQGSNGVVERATGDQLKYTPSPNFHGTDTFSYTLDDGRTKSSVATVTIHVTPVNDAPVAHDDPSYTMLEDGVLAIDTASGGVLANDTDIDPEDAHEAVLDTATENGTFTLFADGRFTYTPPANFFGTVHFTYRSKDFPGTGTSEPSAFSGLATATIVVKPVNDAPVPANKAASTSEDASVAITLSGSDIDSDPLVFTIVRPPAHGRVLGTPPVVSYVPDENFNGTDTFTYRATDIAQTKPNLQSVDVATVTVTVSPVNDAPVAGAQPAVVDEDGSVAITLGGTDVDGPTTLAVVLGTAPANGTLSAVQADGKTVVYTPAPNFNGTDWFTFRVKDDGDALSAELTVQITVNPVNDRPTAGPVSDVTTAEDTAATITLVGADVEAGTLGYGIVRAPSKGRLTGSGSSLTYQPNRDENGDDSFDYTVTDSGGKTSAAATVTLHITSVNDAPIATAQSVFTSEDTAASFSLTVTDADGDALTYELETPPTHGTLDWTGAPSVVYTPASNYTGTDSFSYRAKDATTQSQLVTVQVEVGGINDPPVAQDGAANVAEDTPTTILLSASDPDSTNLSYGVLSGPSHGTLSGTGAQRTYTPAADYTGDDVLTFRASDGSSSSNTGTLTIHVTPVNDAPSITPPAAPVVTEDGSTTITFSGSDADQDDLAYEVVGGGPSHGTLTFDPSDPTKATYVPEADFSGTDSFAVRASDGHGGLSAPITVTIRIDAAGDRPTTSSVSANPTEDETVVLTLTGSDIDGDTVGFALSGSNGGALHGAASISGNKLTYVPAPDFDGTDTVRFVAVDSSAQHLASDEATATITFIAVPEPPRPQPAQVPAFQEDDPARAITLSAFDPETGTTGLFFTVTAQPTHGTLGGSGASLTYVPDANFNGTDTFRYTVSDGAPGQPGALTSPEQTVLIVVAPVGDDPVADTIALSTPEETPVAILLRGHDDDGQALAFELVSAPTGGFLTGTAPNLVFNPSVDFNGEASFQYRVRDAGGSPSAGVLVTITVTAVNDAPVASAFSIVTGEDNPAPVSLDGNDVDGPDAELSYTIVTQPVHGQLTGTAPNLTYVPDLDYSGQDRFTYKVTDKTGTGLESAVATVSITVGGTPDAPFAESQTHSVGEDGTLAISLAGRDADGDTLTFQVTRQPAHGTLVGSLPSVTYAPESNFNGTDTFEYRAVDSTGLQSATVTVTIIVDPVNDAPKADVVAVSLAEDGARSITLTGQDVEGTTLTYEVLTQPAHGALTGTAPDLVYTPAADFFGTDSFTFRVSDGEITSAGSTVSIQVTAVNDPPTASGFSASTGEDTPLTLSLDGADKDDQALSFVVVAGPSHGTISSGTDRGRVYTPAANYNGPDSFTYKVADGHAGGESSVVTVSIDVSAVNDAPVAVAPGTAPSTSEDTGVAFSVGVEDVDDGADASAYTFQVTQQPAAGGTVTAGAAGQMTFAPPLNASGNFTFRFRVIDPHGSASAEVPVTIQVAPVNDAPTAFARSLTTEEDTLLTITLGGSDIEAGALQFVVTAPPASQGTLSGTAPSLVFTPAANFNGTVTFTYRTRDAGGLESPDATVTIVVNAVNDRPTIADTSASTAEDVPLDFTLTGADVETAAGSLTYAITGQPAHGALSGSGRQWTYTPAANFNGQDQVLFTVSDGDKTSAAGKLAITVVPVNDAPAAANVPASIGEDLSAAIALAGSDVDGDGLTYRIVSGPSASQGAASVVGGLLSFTPAQDFNGVVDVTYEATDGVLTSNVATVSITVNPVNDAPVAQPLQLHTLEDTPAVFDVSALDVDTAQGSLSYSVASAPSKGTAVNAGKTFTYTPAADANGPVTFTFRANDGSASSAPATVEVTVDPVNDAPVAASRTATTPEDVTVQILLQATDVDGDPLTYSLATPPTRGAVTISGSVATYVPAGQMNGGDFFTFTASDTPAVGATLTSAPAGVSIAVTAVNDAPIAIAQSVGASEDGSVQITLASTDADAGDAATFDIVAGPSHGTLSGTPPALTYTPASNFNGTDSFTFRVTDGAGAQSAATVVVISVGPVNDAPVATPPSPSVAEDGSVAITLGASDVDGDQLSFTIVSGPAHGTLSGTGAARTYQPAANYNGQDTFRYRVSDGALTAESDVTITISPVNDAPLALGGAAGATEDQAAVLALPAFDVETAAASLSYTIVTAPSHGTAVLGTGGEITYTPAADFNGVDTLTYRVSDGSLTSAAAGTLTIAVTAVPDDPQALSRVIAVDEDTPITFTLSGSDADGDLAGFRLVAAPGGTLQGITTSQTTPAGTAITYKGAANFSGQDSFTFLAIDAAGRTSAQATITLQVAPVNDAPIALAGSTTIAEDGSVAVTLQGMDVEGTSLGFTVTRAPAHGTLSGTAPNFTYAPAADFNGPDSLAFEVSDGALDSLESIFSIVVTPVNDRPLARTKVVQTVEEAEIAFTLEATDVDHDALTFFVVAPPLQGTLAGSGTHLTYTPRANFTGNDRLLFIASDGALSSSPTAIDFRVFDAAGHASMTLRPPQPQLQDGFGFAVSARGHDVLVGAPGYDDVGFVDAGQAYILDAEGNARVLPNPAPSHGDRLGTAVAWAELGGASGTAVALVGAPGETSQGQTGAGVVHVYDPATGILLRTLRAPTAGRDDELGSALVAADGLVYAGAPGTSSGAGVVRVYDVATGSLVRTIANPYPASGDRFGSSIAVLPGGYVAVGAPADRVSGVDAGAVYVFDATGRLVVTLENPDPDAGESFGAALAARGGDLIVGAPGAEGTGAAYVFDGRTGAPLMTLANPTPEPGDGFGFAVAAVENHIAVAAPDDDNHGSFETGAVYLFDGRTGEMLLEVPNPRPGDQRRFGRAIVGTGRDIVVGAPGQDRASTLIGGSVYLVDGNLRPIAQGSHVRVNPGMESRLTLSGTDPNGDAITTTIVVQPAHGTLVERGGQFFYTPEAGYQGEDTVTFVVHDGLLTSTRATTTIDVAPAPEKPRDHFGGSGGCAAAPSGAPVSAGLPYLVVIAGLALTRLRRRRLAAARIAAGRRR